MFILLDTKNPSDVAWERSCQKIAPNSLKRKTNLPLQV